LQTLNIFTRLSIIKNIIARLDRQESELKIDIKDAIERCRIAWNQVNATTIINCFIKAGFHKPELFAITESVPEEVINRETWNKVVGDTDMSYEDYVQVDEKISTHGMKSSTAFDNNR